MGEHKNSDEISLVDLLVGQEVIKSRLNTMELDVNKKHVENRTSIHTLRNSVQDVSDEVWKLKVKIGGYASLAGVITAILIKLVEHALR